MRVVQSRVRRIVVAVVAVGLVVAGCTGGDEPDASETTATATDSAGDGLVPATGVGYVVEASTVSGHAFEDTDGDGVRDEGEAGMPSVRVVVGLPDGGPQVSTLTRPDGTWQVQMGTDRFEVWVDAASLPSGGWAPTATPGDQPLDVPSGTTTADVNFGFRPADPVTLSGMVFEENANLGTRDFGEEGFPAVVDFRPATPGGEWKQAITADDGTFRISFDTPVDHVVSVPADSLPDGAWEQTTEPVVVAVQGAAGDTVEDLDFGFREVEPTTIAGWTFEDANGNGVRDDGEGFQSVVDFEPVDESGEWRQVITAEDGSFRVTFDGPVNHVATVPADALPEGTWEATVGPPTPLEVAAGDGDDVAVDFGFQRVEPARVSGTVFEDANGNGARDDGEGGVQSFVDFQPVADDVEWRGAITATDGTYEVQFPTVARHVVTVPPTGLPDGTWVRTTDPAAYTLEVAPGSEETDVDFGFQQLQTDGYGSGVVFEDVDGNGRQDDGEEGLADVTVVLTDLADGRAQEVVTDGDGAWSVDAGVLGWVAHVDPETLPERVGGTPAQTTEPGTHVVGRPRSDLDFGFQWQTVAGGASSEEPAASTAPPSEPDATTAPPVVTADCVPGTWSLDSQAFVDSLVENAGGLPATDATYEGGRYTMTFTRDDTYTGVREDWELGFSAPEGTLYVRMTGEQRGTAEFDLDGTVSFAEEASDVQVVAEVEQAGARIRVPAGGGEYETDAVSGTAKWDCQGDVLTITQSTGVVTRFTRLT